MKKKILFLFCLLVAILPALVASGRFIEADKLPKKVQNFLEEFFPDEVVRYAEKEGKEYEVTLKNGTEIDFDKKGNWETVDGNYRAIPLALIPKLVLTAVVDLYPTALIIKIEKDWGGYDLELDNRIELKIRKNGEIHEIELDD